MKTCFFIGHHDAPDEILAALIAEVERHISEYGVEEFVVGRYGNFDVLAERAVKEVKERHPGILLTRLLPYHPGERPIELPNYFDGSFYPPLEGVPRRLAIVRANIICTLCRWQSVMLFLKNGILLFLRHNNLRTTKCRAKIVSNAAIMLR